MTKKKKIAVNARFLLPNKREGIGTYSHEILQRLVHLLPEYEFHFLFDRAYDKQFIYNNNIRAHRIGLPARHPILWYFWFEFAVHKWLDKNPCDLFFSPDSFLSLRNETATLLAMHDIGFEHFEKHTSSLAQGYYRKYFPQYAKHAKHIVSVSEYTKQDLMNLYGIAEKKISVINCGVSNRYETLTDLKKDNIRSSLTNGLPYFLIVGSINPRKNMERMLQAFKLWKMKSGKEHRLVIVGAKGWLTKAFDTEIKKGDYAKDIILTGHLESAELNEVLNAASALLFVSLFEGFGIPIVEAFKVGTPVITANNSSMPEVAGNAGILVEATNLSEIVGAMDQVLEPKTRKRLIENARFRHPLFDWDKSATKLANIVQQLLD